MAEVVSPIKLLHKPAAFLAFGFGSGLSPIMPGTVGTVAAVPLYFALTLLPHWAYALIVMVSAIVGIYLCGITAKWMGTHDHGSIVWDEFVGFWITMFLVPTGWPWVLAGFIFFRVFDMLKPWPISLADKHVHGGFGIMLDDVLAGIAAALCLHGVNVFLKG